MKFTISFLLCKLVEREREKLMIIEIYFNVTRRITENFRDFSENQRMCKQCVPGVFFPLPLPRTPGNEAISDCNLSVMGSK